MGVFELMYALQQHSLEMAVRSKKGQGKARLCCGNLIDKCHYNTVAFAGFFVVSSTLSILEQQMPLSSARSRMPHTLSI